MLILPTPNSLLPTRPKIFEFQPQLIAAFPGVAEQRSNDVDSCSGTCFRSATGRSPEHRLDPFSGGSQRQAHMTPVLAHDQLVLHQYVGKPQDRTLVAGSKGLQPLDRVRGSCVQLLGLDI